MQLDSYSRRRQLIRKIIFWSIIIGGLLALFVPTLVRAEIVPGQPIDPCTNGFFCVKGITENPEYTEGTPAQRISNIIIFAAGILAFVAASVAVIFIIRGAWEMMNSGGDSSKYQKAVMGMVYAVIGLVVVAVSFSLVQVVVNIISGFQV